MFNRMLCEYNDILIETLILLQTDNLIKTALTCKFFNNVFAENIRSYAIDTNPHIKEEQFIFFKNVRKINLPYTKVKGHGLIYYKTVDEIYITGAWHVTVATYCYLDSDNIRFVKNASSLTTNVGNTQYYRYIKNSH